MTRLASPSSFDAFGTLLFFQAVAYASTSCSALLQPYNTGAGGGTADYVFALMFGTVMTCLTYPLIGMLIPTPPVFARTLSKFSNDSKTAMFSLLFLTFDMT